MTSSVLRQKAEAEASHLLPLLVQADYLAGAILLGEHGRRRSGLGDDFWQYRPVQIGDSKRYIDHRRSASGDVDFVREREWKIAQSVIFWVDQGASMRWASKKNRPRKIDHSRLLALATAILSVRGGERVGLTNVTLPPRCERQQIFRMAEAFSQDAEVDYEPPDYSAMRSHSRAVFISDFLSDMDVIREALGEAVNKGIKGVLLQVLDPDEELFPYQGRTIFDSVGGTLTHQTLKASDLRSQYLDRLANRKLELRVLASEVGWQYGRHQTDRDPQSALLWLYGALDGTAT